MMMLKTERLLSFTTMLQSCSICEYRQRQFGWTMWVEQNTDTQAKTIRTPCTAYSDITQSACFHPITNQSIVYGIFDSECCRRVCVCEHALQRCACLLDAPHSTVDTTVAQRCAIMHRAATNEMVTPAHIHKTSPSPRIQVDSMLWLAYPCRFMRDQTAVVARRQSIRLVLQVIDCTQALLTEHKQQAATMHTEHEFADI